MSRSQQLRQHRCVVREPTERATAPGLERYRRPKQALFVGGTGPYWAPLVRERPGFEHDNQEDAWRRAATR